MGSSLTVEQLKHALLYVSETGGFYRRRGCHGKAAGTLAGSADDRGYVHVTVRGRPYMAHRLAFLYMTGMWPINNVDHLNGQPSDNRWINLSDRPQSENVARARQPNKQIGSRGIRFHKGAWEANVKVDGKSHYLGRFQEQHAAEVAYKEACRRLGRGFIFDAALPTAECPAPFCAAAIAAPTARIPVTVEEARRLFHYDRETGAITRKVPARGHIHPVGGAAGSIQKEWGYRIIKIRSQGFLAHRLAWAIETGEWPTRAIDHINGDPDDVRWTNLRLATASQNMANRRLFRNNRSGAKGVCRSGNKYLATIYYNKQRVPLGRFDTVAEAAMAYSEAATRLHGEFARAA